MNHREQTALLKTLGIPESEINGLKYIDRQSVKALASSVITGKTPGNVYAAIRLSVWLTDIFPQEKA
jgi:hypothetical protein